MTARQAKPHGVSEMQLAIILSIHEELKEFRNVAYQGWRTHLVERDRVFRFQDPSQDPTEIKESGGWERNGQEGV